MQIGAMMIASLLHCLQGCDSSTASNKDCSLSHLEHCPNSMDSATNTATPFLSLLLTHHFLVMDVDCYLTCTSVIPAIIWFIVLDLGLFKSPFHICVRHTNWLPHALSSALLLFHARSWKHPPQSRHSFSSEGPTPSLSVSWLVGTHAVRLTDSHGGRLLLFSSSGRHTPSFLCLLFIVDTRLPPLRMAYPTHGSLPTHGELLLLLGVCIGDSRPLLFIVNLLSWLFTWLLTWLHDPLVLHGSAWLFLTLGSAIFFFLLWLIHRQGLRLLLHSLMHFITDGVAVFFFVKMCQSQHWHVPSIGMQ